MTAVSRRLVSLFNDIWKAELREDSPLATSKITFLCCCDHFDLCSFGEFGILLRCTATLPRSGCQERDRHFMMPSLQPRKPRSVVTTKMAMKKATQPSQGDRHRDSLFATARDLKPRQPQWRKNTPNEAPLPPLFRRRKTSRPRR